MTSTTNNLTLRLADDVKNPNEKSEGESYLQISLPDRVFLYDLNFSSPRECFSCFNTDFFFDSRNYVDIGLPNIYS